MNTESSDSATRTLVVSTRNAHKLCEIAAILGPSFRCLSLERFPSAPKVVEDAGTFEGNATKKAVELARWLACQPDLTELSAGKPLFVLADDSGLEVDALDGAPGVHSARFAGGSSSGNSPDHQNNERLLEFLAKVPERLRTARFRCVLALTPVPVAGLTSSCSVCPGGEAESGTEIFTGACEGRIAFKPQGEKGFGYDPLFVPDGMSVSFAQLGDAVKNEISHRARALEKLGRRFER